MAYIVASLNFDYVTNIRVKVYMRELKFVKHMYVFFANYISRVIKFASTDEAYSVIVMVKHVKDKQSHILKFALTMLLFL